MYIAKAGKEPTELRRRRNHPWTWGDQADEAWLFSVQRKLYLWSRTHPEDSYRDLWNWITDIRNLRCAWRKIALNKGRRTAGVDGMTVAGIRVAMGMECSWNNSMAT